MEHIYFEHPAYLYSLLLFIPFVLGLIYFSVANKLKLWNAYGDEALLLRYARKPSLQQNIFKNSLWVVALSLIAVALASPMLPKAPKRIPVGNVQMVAVFDVSRSMAAKDYMGDFKTLSGKACVYNSDEDCGSRLQMAKYYFRHYILGKLGNDKISLVTFAGKGYEQAPLTNDLPAEIWILHNWVTIGNAPGYGSYTARGLEQAVNEFPKVAKPGTNRVIVYFSDGGFNGSSTHLAAVLAKMNELKIKLVVVGVGSKIPSPIPTYDSNNHFSGYFAPGGTIITTAYDESFMMGLAQAANGIYLRVGQHHIDNFKLNSIVSGFKLKPETTNLYQYPLGLALIIIMIILAFNLKFSIKSFLNHSTHMEK